MALGILLWGCQAPFNLADMLDGPDGIALSITPTSGTLQINDSISIVATGGVPPYEYSVVDGSGSFTGSLYTAPATPGEETIRVADSLGNQVDALFTVKSGGVVLGITPANGTVYTGQSVDFSPVGGAEPFAFEITSNESNGTIVGGTYTAGNLAGTDVVTVTDATAAISTATITVESKPLSISPSVISIYLNQTVDFSPVGGDGPFTYEITTNGTGAAPMTDGTYTAGPAAGTDLVTLTDSFDGRTRTATITVVNTATSVDYHPTQIVSIVPVDLLTGENFDAEFSIENNGAAPGQEEIVWTVYASDDTSIGGTDDRIAATGTLGGTTAGSLTAVPFTGTWPSEEGIYYLLVSLYAADDLASGDNENQSASTTQIYAPLAISPAVASVYSGQQIDFTATGGTGSYSFNLVATGSGVPTMGGSTYTAGAGEGTDIVQVSDLTYPGWAAASASITVTSAPPPPAGDTEYIVSLISALDPSPDVSSPITESFTLQNTGVDDGAASINWAVYLSQDNNPSFSAGDQIVDTGYEPPLTGDDTSAGGTDETTVSPSGTWPASAGTWHLKVREWSDDEVVPNEWYVSAPFDLQPVSVDVDYYVSTPPAGGMAVSLGDPVSAGFEITNDGSDPGTATVMWWAYISSNATYGTGDTEIDSGSFGGLGAGAPSGPLTIDSGTWDTVGTYYLLIRIHATDEVNTADNIGASDDSYSVADAGATEPDYSVSAITMYSPYVPSGSSVAESFTIANVGSDGGANVVWTAFASDDQVPDPGEEIGTGFVGPLLSGGSLSGIPLVSATWPVTAGDYYLIVSETAADEVNVDDYNVSLSTFTVADPPDYTVQSVTYPLSAEQGTAATGGFDITNIGAGDGTGNITWEVYLSYNSGLDIDDLLIGSGQIGPLTAAGSTTILPSDLSIANWPFLGLGYVIVDISASDDSDTSNDRFVSAATELYVLDTEGADHSGAPNDGSGKSMGSIAGTQYIGNISLGQTLVVKGWLDNSASHKFDTYSFDLDPGSGVTIVSTHATWSTGTDIGQLTVWDEFNNEFSSAISVPDREPDFGSLSIVGWSPPETAYVAIESYEFIDYLNPAHETPYTIYIKGEQ